MIFKHSKKNYYIILLFISFFYVFTKYFISYYYYQDEKLLLKILRLSQDQEYFYLVESLSRFDFYTKWSKYQIANNIIGFPIFSVVWHAIIFLFLNYYTFLILEYFLFFLLSVILFNIFLKIDLNLKKSLLAVLLLYIIINFFLLAQNFNIISHNFNNSPGEFVGNRFPRPMITSIYSFVIIYNLLCINQRLEKLPIKNVTIIGICLLFLK
jgi:hypothetical protein